MSNPPLVSVIMAVYNSDAYLSQAIESILNQTYTNFEFIIIDDGSTDNTHNILEKYKKKDSRIILLENHKNGGLPFSLNKGLEKAKGKFVARMDADDISVKNRLELQIDFLQKNDEIDIIGCELEIIDKSGSPTGTIWRYKQIPEQISFEAFFTSPIPHAAMVAKTDIFKKESFRYNEKYLVAQDYELWSRLILTKTFSNLPKPLYKCRFSRKSINPIRQQLTNEIRKKQLTTRLDLKITDREWKIHKYIFLFSTEQKFTDISPKEITLWLNKFISAVFEKNIAPADVVYKYLREKKYVEIAFRKLVQNQKKNITPSLIQFYFLNLKIYDQKEKILIIMKIIKDFFIKKYKSA
jgi:glycosyltransferase involved in cell wall biosynthesis